MTRLVIMSFTAAAVLVPAGIVVQRAAIAARSERLPGAVSFGFEVGEQVFDFAFTDLAGRTGTLSTVIGPRATAIVIRDHGCPVSQKYGPRLAELERTYAPQGVSFVYVNVAPPDSAEPPGVDAARQGFTGRYVVDTDSRIVNALRVASTAEVFVLDETRTLVYRGAVDDQYGLGFTRPAARHNYMMDALDDVVAGREVRTKASEASGCILGTERTVRGKPLAVTYHNRVSRIIQNNCQTCHRTGGIAPFPMETYKQVYARRQTIDFMVSSGRMPPWFAAKDTGEWANDRSLSERDKADLLAWIKAGAPEGKKKDAPKPRQWVQGWNIGRPDAVIEIPEAQTIPAQGVVDYKYLYVKTDFPEDRWIQRMEIRPTSPKVMHHVLVFLEEPGRKQGEDRQPGDPPFQGGLGGYFAATVPGYTGITFPEGLAKKLAAGTWLKFQLHYTPNGTEAVDKTQLGLIFADKPPTAEVRTSAAFDTKFVIPPGVDHYEVKGEYTFRAPGMLMTLFPHMHLRGAAFRYDLVYPDGREQVLLSVPRYDFNWQLYYEMKRPIEVPAGARLRATGWFDNSSKNPFNPDPTREVRFGEQTFDEMMIGYFDWVMKAQ